jgi:hypothetical protein
MRVARAVAFLVFAALLCVPATARADGYVNPYIGTNFQNNSGNGRAAFGVGGGYMGAGVIGAEVDAGWAPSFFGNQGEFGSNYVFDLMGNLIVGAPLGGTRGRGVRPYATVGIGLIRSQYSVGPANTVAGSVLVHNNDPGMNAGVGVMGFANQHVGIRGDVRYFRNLDENSPIHDIDFGTLHFWRASFGLLLR